MPKQSRRAQIVTIVAILAIGGGILYANFGMLPVSGALGGPIAGLNPEELRKFRDCEKIFVKKFTIEEGLGPLYNRKSCYECHGSPGIAGGEGSPLDTTDLIWIAKLKEGTDISKEDVADRKFRISSKDVSFLPESGGPFLYRSSITDEAIKGLEADCKLQATSKIPPAQFVSHRHAPPVFGAGLINAIPDDDLDDHEDDETSENVDLAGRSVDIDDPLTGKQRIGRFGWKTEQPTLVNMVSFMLSAGPAVSTPIFPERIPLQDVPRCLMPVLPAEPNDMGKTAARLIYYLTMLDGPKRGEITPDVTRGEKTFEKLNCAFCHTPEMQTAPKVRVIDPDSPAPKFKYYYSDALSDRPVALYSDLLLHYMGEALADGVPQGRAGGGEWRTPPLWGLRFRKFLMHDGRADSIENAVLMHGGQASESRQEFEKLNKADRAALIEFLKSL